MTKIFRYILRNIFFGITKAIFSALPRNKAFDRIYQLSSFYRAHYRFPSNKMLLNDVLYRIKTSNEIVDPLRVFTSDKEYLKWYVRMVVGEKFNVPTLGIIQNKNDLLTYKFPDKCVIKPTHSSGRVILRKNGEPIDLKIIMKWFDHNHYKSGREANYKFLKKKVIVEPIIFNNKNIVDYKIYCYMGKPKLIQVDIDRHSDHKRLFFNSLWQKQNFSSCYPVFKNNFKKPNNLKSMLKLASDLSKEFNLVRVDIYSNGKECLVGEITHCPANAHEVFIPRTSEKIASKIIFESLA
jgi:hypothetical protein